MNIVDANENDLVSRLRRLDASGVAEVPGFDYDGMLERHGRRQLQKRRRASIARASAALLVIAVIGVSVWRFEASDDVTPMAATPTQTPAPDPQSPARTDAVPERRLVRADTYFALAALEDHIASIDDALSYARLGAPGSGLDSADVMRLERTRAELLDSYVRVRYADTVAANF